MGELETKLGEVSLSGTTSPYQRTPFGKEMKAKHFLFAENWRNMNHGSYGTIPRAIRDKQRKYQEECENSPDLFIRYTIPRLLDESREAVAKLLNAPVNTVVFVPNATTGVNTVLRNLVWNEDGQDEVLYFSTIYGACGLTVDYVSELSHGRMVGRKIPISYPIEDEDLVEAFEKGIAASKAEGKRPRVAVFDTITSVPGIRVPFEILVSVCRKENIFSLIDGAHCIGHIPIDLSALDPDFFVSNCHKWLHVPRGCAVFYVPEKHQGLIRSSLPTSHGFVAKHTRYVNPLPPSAKSSFVNQFEYVGTVDNTNYLCVAEAIKWREEVCGGETAITDYCKNLSREGGALVAKMLGTEVMDNSRNSLTDCCLVNVLLPITIGEEKVEGMVNVSESNKMKAYLWMVDTLMKDYNTWILIAYLDGKWWTRLSGQVYLDMEDFQWAGRTLKELCMRVGSGDYLRSGE